MVSMTGSLAKGRALVAELLNTLREWPWFDTARTLRQRFREDHLGLTAGSLTFTTLIALVPLLTVMLAIFSAFPMFSSFRSALEHFFLQNLVPDTIAQPVLKWLTQFAGKANQLGTVGLLLLVGTALALMLTIDRTLNGIWRVRRRRPFAKRLLVYWGALTLGPLALGASLTLTSYALSASRGLATAMPGGVSVLADVMQFMLLAAAATALFLYVPNVHVRLVHALSGGLFVAIVFELAKQLLGWWIAAVPTYGAVYGTFATVPILLLWIYLVWVIVLLGAVIAAYAPTLQMRVEHRAQVPGRQFELALAIVGRLAAVRHSPRHGLAPLELAEELRTDPLQIEPLLEMLTELGWVARLDEDGAQRHVLLVDTEHTPARELIDRLLLAPVAGVQGFRRQAGIESMSLAALLRA
jgi:membrane protein